MRGGRGALGPFGGRTDPPPADAGGLGLVLFAIYAPFMTVQRKKAAPGFSPDAASSLLAVERLLTND